MATDMASAEGIDIAAAFGDDDGPNLPPQEPAVSPGKWMKDNLFSSVGNSILTLFFAVVVFVAFRGLLNFAFHNPARNWISVPTNIRLLMTQAYPADSYERVWISVGIILVLAGLTVGMSKHIPYIAIRKLLNGSMVLGAALVAGALLIKNNIQTDDAGEFLRDADAEVLRVSRGEALSGRWWVFAIAAVLILVPLAITASLGDRRRFINFNFHRVIYVFFGLAVASLWVVPYGKYGLLEDGSFLAEKGVTVALSTKLPWTIEWFVLGLAYLVGRALTPTGTIKKAIYLGWFLAPYVIIFAILRAPIIDWNTVITSDAVWFVGFAVVGGAIMTLLTKPELGERGRVIAFGLLMVAVLHWVAAFFGWYDILGGWFDMQQKNRLSVTVLALFALGAHNFAGVTKVRMGYVLAWVGTMFTMHVLITIVNTPSALDGLPADSFIGGFLMSLVLTVFSLTLAFPVGIMLALARTSKLPIFRLLSTTFIEVSRGVPLITVLFFFATVIPLFLPDGMEITKLAAAVVALILFSSAYVAENIRGGLQSVLRGQFEAADAMGLSTAQRTSLIVLPQALRVSIPPLVGQAIATYKETSLIAIIGLFDLLLIANRTIPNQSVFRGHRFEPLLVASVIYWVGAYAMSRYSRSIEQRLGVGSR